jgi:hypothetical protein
VCWRTTHTNSVGAISHICGRNYAHDWNIFDAHDMCSCHPLSRRHARQTLSTMSFLRVGLASSPSAKEAALIEDIKSEIAQGRKVQGVRYFHW